MDSHLSKAGSLVGWKSLGLAVVLLVLGLGLAGLLITRDQLEGPSEGLESPAPEHAGRERHD